MKASIPAKIPDKTIPTDELNHRLHELAWTGQHTRVIELANAGKSPVHKAQALNRKTLVQLTGKSVEVQVYSVPTDQKG